MSRRSTVITVTALLTASGSICADNHKHAKDSVSSIDPPIKITINPEARVSVVLGGALPPPAACGTVVDLRVQIVNQGFVTSVLEAELVGDKPAWVTLDFHPEPLKGISEELRNLSIKLRKPGPTDLTIAFRAHNDAPDLGGRDRIHFLMDCMESRET